MKKITKISAALAIAAMASTASAQISNTIYFDKYNYRQHHLNPAMMPDQRFYFSVVGNVAMDFGNKSLSFSDVVKNVNGKSVLFLDKSLNGTSERKGQKDFLDALGKKLHIFANTYVDILDFGFRIGDKSFLGVSMGAHVGTNVMLPKGIFETVLQKREKDDALVIDAGDLYLDAYAYTETGITFAHQFGEKLNLGITGKYLWGGASAKTDFSKVTIRGDMNEWVMSGTAEIMASYPGLVATTDSDGNLKVENEMDDINWNDFKGNHGFALDLGGTYKLTQKITLAASITDLGFINYSNNVARISMTKDFRFEGADFKEGKRDPQTHMKDDGELDFKQYEDEFKQTFQPNGTSNFVQGLNTKVYLGASWEPIKIIGFGFLSKTTFAHKKVWQEFSASANLHPIRLLSINGMYSMMDGSWHALGLGVNINLGPLNIFAACDNIPVHYGKLADDNNVIFPDKLTSTRINFGLGLVIGSKEHQAKRRAKKEEKEKEKSIIDDNWRTDTPEPDFYDADGDGVEDDKDHCPNTDADVPVDEDGCPADNDGDGVPDYLDKCPGTPTGSKVDENGCVADSDSDGVPDDIDRCPNTPQGVSVDSKGCPSDDDNDGVPDYLDKCPNTPSSAKTDAAGCPLDTDNDGIPDYMDSCPEVAGVAANNGCPEIKQEVQQVFKKALNGIQFETGKSKITKSSYTILDDIVKIMKENPSYKLFIKGHTDNDGNADMNLQLSKDRAAEVLKYLKNKGVDESRMHSEGYGDTKPIVPNNSAANKAKNRRVEFEVEF